MNKPNYPYTDLVSAMIGMPAIILKGEKLVRTSNVVRFDVETGIIETQNSIYVPVDEN